LGGLAAAAVPVLPGLVFSPGVFAAGEDGVAGAALSACFAYFSAHSDFFSLPVKEIPRVEIKSLNSTTFNLDNCFPVSMGSTLHYEVIKPVLNSFWYSET
jgi:hypothetical protein